MEFWNAWGGPKITKILNDVPTECIEIVGHSDLLVSQYLITFYLMGYSQDRMKVQQKFTLFFYKNL